MIKNKIIIITSIIAICCVSILFVYRENNSKDTVTSDSNEAKDTINTDVTGKYSEEVSDDFRTTFTSIFDESEPDVKLRVGN